MSSETAGMSMQSPSVFRAPVSPQMLWVHSMSTVGEIVACVALVHSSCHREGHE